MCKWENVRMRKCANEEMKKLRMKCEKRDVKGEMKN
jgi:hypothetical protein